MLLYSYLCDCGNLFEALNKMDERHTEPCPTCEGTAKMKIEPIRIDSNIDCPGARMKWRKEALRRARGADMTAANKNVADETIVRDAFLTRQGRHENTFYKT